MFKVDAETIATTIGLLDKFKESIMAQLRAVRQYEINNPHVRDHNYPEQSRFYGNASNYAHECFSRQGISFYFESFSHEDGKLFANVLIDGFEYGHQLVLDVTVDHYAIYVAQYEQWEANYQARLVDEANKKLAAERAQFEALKAKFEQAEF